VIGSAGQERVTFHVYPKRMKISKIRLFFVMFVVTTVLSSCVTMVSHMFAMREQVCEFDEYFSVSLDHGVEVELSEPVLLESEVFLMLGAAPTTRVVTADGMTASYTFEQLQTASKNHSDFIGEEFELRLLFISSEKGFLLSGIQSSEIPAELMDSALAVLTNSTEIARQACDMPINPLSRSVVVEIDRDMLELLPERHTVVSWLGPDIESSGNSADLTYEFQLKGEGTDLPIARIDASYGQAGELPVAIDASFTHYNMSIDVPAGTMRVKLHF
jgi:hypothetical protein